MVIGTKLAARALTLIAMLLALTAGVGGQASAATYAKPIFADIRVSGCMGYVKLNNLSPMTCVVGIPGADLGPGAAVANIGYTPANVASNLSDLTDKKAARGASGINIERLTTAGDADYTILPTDREVAHSALTAPRVDTLPAASSVNAGGTITIQDHFGVVTGTNTLTIQPAGTDTINGGTSYVLSNAYAGATFRSDGVSRWSYQQPAPIITVTSVATGAGLVGGPITTTGTVSEDFSARPVRVRQTVQGGPTQLSGTATVTIATPGVVTFTGSNLTVGTPVFFTTTGSLPTGLAPNTVYYVSVTGLTANSFSLSTTVANAYAGTNIATSGTQSGTHTLFADMGFPTFLPATSGSLSITTQNISPSSPLCITAANGYDGTNYGEKNLTGCATTNLTWSGLPASSTVYLSVDLSCGAGVCTLTPTSTTVAPVYQFGGLASVSSNAFTYNISEARGYCGNGSAAVQCYRVFVGEVTTNGSGVTASVAYAYNGLYDSGWTQNLPATSTVTSKNHNIGTNLILPRMVLENTTADDGYAVGDQVTLVSQISYTRLATSFSQSNSQIAMVPKGGGAPVALTQNSWKWKSVVQRSF
jgi:hypothetical protein